MVGHFIDYISLVRRAKPLTVRNYSAALIEFEKFRNGQIINQFLINSFQVHLAKKNLSPSTVNGYLSALRMYLKWQESNEIKTFDWRKIELLPTQKSPKDYLTKDELQAFFDVIETKTVIGLRNKTMMSVLYVTGLRVSELVNLNRDSINFASKEISIEGKGGKYRLVYLTDSSIKLCKEYLKTRSDDFPALFISYKNTSKTHRISTVMVEIIVKKIAQKAKITKDVTPHCLRRSFATNLHLNGCPITGIQTLLGHSSVMTTQVYIRFSDKEARSLHQKFLTTIP